MNIDSWVYIGVERESEKREREKEEKEMPIIAVLLPAEGVKSYIRFPLLLPLCLSVSLSLRHLMAIGNDC